MNELVVTLMGSVAGAATKEVASAIIQRALEADLSGNLTKTLRLAAVEAEAQTESGRGVGDEIRAGELARFVNTASCVDDSDLQVLWARLLSNALRGACPSGRMTWAMATLEQLSGVDAVVLAACCSGFPTIWNEPSREDTEERGAELDASLTFLADLGLLTIDDMNPSRLADHLRLHAGRKPIRGTIYGIAVVSSYERHLDAAMVRGVKSTTSTFCEMVGLGPTEDFGIYQDVLLRPDTALGRLESLRGTPRWT